ncbi:MAG: GNAT family N-acetyltransferase [Aquihabitans sp.]
MERLPELIEHDGLVLRRWTAADAETVEALVTANLEHLRPYMAWIAAEPMAIEDRRALERQWEEQWLAGGDVILGIFEDGTAVGSTGLHRRIGPGGLEIGYWVAADHLGKGIARRASEGLTNAAFTLPGIDRVEIRHDISNAYSRNVPKLLGFTLIGRDDPNRDTKAPAETGVDLVWRVTRDEWLTR